MANEAKILDVRQMPSADPKRPTDKDTHVTYQLAGGRVASVTLTKPSPTTADIAAAIKAQEAARHKAIGTTVAID